MIETDNQESDISFDPDSIYNDDTQEFIYLKQRKGVIEDGINRFSENPNKVGYI